MELFAQSVLAEIKAANNDIRKALEGLRGEALNWHPTGQEDNSLYALATHIVGAQRWAVANTLGKTIERDRAAEFVAKGSDVAPLLVAIEQAEAEIEGWLSAATAEDLARPSMVFGQEAPAAQWLAYVLRHLGEHAGHAALTRQLWEQRKGQQVSR